MSASPHAWPRAAAAILLLLAAAACGGGGGGGPDIPAPVVLSVMDETGAAPVKLVFSGDRKRVTIKGNNFLATATGDTRHHAFVDGVELTGWRPGVPPEPAIVEVDQVQWVDSHTLRAVIPAGLEAGSKTLTVENAYGKRGSLKDAFTVQTTAGAALAVDLSLTPTTVNVGQTLTVQATVKNAGSAAATGVVASLKLSSTDGASGSVTAGPDPTSVPTLAPGESATFSWAVTATGPGTLAIEVGATGQDVFSNLPVTSDPVSESEVVQLPAGLTATIVATNAVVASRHTVDVGQAISVTFSVANGGTATADLSSVALVNTGTATGVTCTGPSPAIPQSVGAQEKRDFTFSCRATGAGVLQIGGNVAGTDHTSHAPLSDAATPDTISVQTPPSLSAALTRDPTTISLGQTVSVTLTISNAGGASATLTRAPVPTAAVGTDQTKVSCGAPSPASLQSIPGGGNVTYTWTCAPIATGTLNLGAQVSTSDDNTHVALAQVNAPNVTVSVQNPATLVAVTQATSTAPNPSTVDVGQTVSVTFTLINGGSAAADVSSVAAVVDPTSTAAAACTAPLRNGQPLVTPFSIPGNSNAILTWTCVPSPLASGTSATLVLSGAVVAADHNSGAVLTPTVTTFSLTVQTAASVTSTSLIATPTTVDSAPPPGQSSAIVLTLRNSGGATARVTVTPTASPASGVNCGPTPTPSQAIAGMGTVEVGWTCTSTVAGTHAYGANVTAVDVNTGASISVPVTAASVLVQTPASLVAAFSVHPTAADTNQQVSFTLHVTNNGDATANVATVTPLPQAGLSCPGPVTPTPSTTSIAGHASRDFAFTCSAAAAASYTLGATVGAADANNGGSADATAANVALAVQAPAALTASLAASRTTIDVTQAVNLTLTVNNTGGGSAQVTAVAPSPASGAVTCPSGPTQTLPVTIAGGGTATFTWACTGASAGTATLDATVTAASVNTGAALSPPVTGVGVTVQAAAALTASLAASRATIDVTQAVNLTLTVNNTGGGSAQVTAVAPSPASGVVTCPTGPTQALPVTIAGGGTATFTWACTGASAGSATLDATVTATNLNTGAALSPPVTGVGVTVQTAAALTASLAASRTTIDVTQAVNLTLTVNNTGGGSAQVTAVAPSPASGAVTCPSGPTQALPVTIAGGGTATFTWACTGASAGTATLDATVTAANLNTGAALSPAVTGVGVTVQTAAALTASLAASRATIDVTQAVNLTLTVNNTGGGSAQVTAVAPSPASGAVTCPSGPTQALPVTIAGGGTATFTWACTGLAAGTATLDATVTAASVNTGAALSPPVTGVGVTVQTAAALTASLAASRTTIDVTQAVNLTLTVNNTGGGSAQVTAVAPSPASGAVTCPSGPTQTLPVTIAGGGTATFTWACTGASAGTATLDATVTAASVNTGAALSPPVTGVGVTVQAAAALTASLAASRATIDVTQAVNLTLTVNNTGGGSAQVTAVAPSPASGAVTCPSGPTQALPVTIAGGGTATFTWACTGASAGSATLDATVTATNLNTGAALSPPVTGVGVTVQTAAALTASLAASRATIDVTQAVNLTLTVNNTGGGSAQVTAVAPSPASGAVTCPSGPTQALPVTIAGGGTATFTWACTGAAAGTATLDAIVTAANLNTGAALSPAVAGVGVTVQTAAVLTATLVATTPTTIAVTQTVSLSLTVNNTGGGSAQVTAVAPSPASGVVNCPAGPTQALPVTIAGGGSATFTWACTGASAGTATLDATVTASNVNTGAGLSPPVTGVGVTVQNAGQLAVSIAATPTTANTNQSVPVTATFTNNGGSAVTVSALAGTVATVSGSCGSYSLAVPFMVPTVGGPVTLTWSCSATATGTATLGATLTATDANSVAVTPAVTTDSLTIQTRAQFTATSLGASLATAAVAQPVTMTLSLTNSGTSTARISVLTPSFAAGTCGSPTPAVPFDAPAGVTTVTWTCTPGAAALSASLGVALTATDLNDSANVSPTVAPTSVTVVEVPLTATLAVIAGLPVSAATGGTVTLSLVVTNPAIAFASAHLSSVTASVDATNAAGFSCTGPTVTAQDLAPNASTAAISWACATAGGAVNAASTLGTNVGATDLTSGGNVSPAVSGVMVALQ